MMRLFLSTIQTFLARMVTILQREQAQSTGQQGASLDVPGVRGIQGGTPIQSPQRPSSGGTRGKVRAITHLCIRTQHVSSPILYIANPH